MKYLAVLFILLSPLGICTGQTVHIDSVSPLKVCAGDAITVFYSSTGKFDSLSLFRVQISDSNGVFTSSPIIAQSKLQSGVMKVVWYKHGDHYRLVMYSTQPITISTDTSPEIQILSIPDPKLVMKIPKTNLGGTALVGELIQFEDTTSEAGGSHFLWNFADDASIIHSTIQSPAFSYASEGIKSGTLMVTNPLGCVVTTGFNVRILSCTPVIPYFSKDSLFHICTGTGSGYHANVWVKSGGNYTTKGHQTIFVEPGGTVQAGIGSNSLYYLKKGAVFSDNKSSSSVILLNSGETITYENMKIDTFYCDDLQFDYSKVGGTNDVRTTDSPLHILNSPTTLRISSNGESIKVSIVDLLGAEMISATERDMLTLDLTSLPGGVYFAIITSGNHREMRKITVIH